MREVVIRGGTVVDGTGAPPRTADVAIDGGVVSEVGRVGDRGRTEVDADGLVVTPGFVDVHTHYDGQVSWDPLVTPSSWHGVTTVVMGNCGVGFAPVRPTDHEWLIGLMEGVEDIPGAALAEGITWEWESFPEYLDAVERVGHAIDIGAQVPHGALRAYVMGERGADHEADPTAEEIEAMYRLTRAAIEAGALGFSTSRTRRHRTRDGALTPSLSAPPDELHGIGRALGDAGAGVFEVVSDFDDPEEEFALLRRLAESTGRPISISLSQHDTAPDAWRHMLEMIERANGEGVPMTAQVAPRPIGVLLGLEATLNPFSGHATYREIESLPLAERVARMRDPEVRARLLAERPEAPGMVAFITSTFAKLFELGDPPDYEQPPEQSIEARARRAGVEPLELVYDMVLERGGKGLLYFPLFNYSQFDLEPSREMLLHPHTVPGLSDGGAHCGAICDVSFPTSMLTHWSRDRSRGERMPLEWVVMRQTRDTARLVGLDDRGVLAPGMRADVNVVDYDGLRLRPPEIVHDLPAGGRRLVQRAEGYRHTFVAGVETFRDGEHTGALPGSLVRGARRAPAASR